MGTFHRQEAGTGRPGAWPRRSLAIAASLACTAISAAVPAVASAAPARANAVDQPHHGLGLIWSRPAVVPAATAAKIDAKAATLPASVDLTPFAAPVGNQGQVGSCAAWSTNYSALGYWENKQGLPSAALEPMYSYTQVDGGRDAGSTIEGNLYIAQSQGIDRQTDYWQGNFDYTTQPTMAQKAYAVNWKLSSYSNLSIVPSSSSQVTENSIKAALAAGDPVVIGIPVYSNFYYVGSANNGYYGGVSGSLQGYHAVTALGYNSQGLVIENQWGSGWGHSGFATLAWTFVNLRTDDAVQVGPIKTGRPVISTPPTISGTASQARTLTATSGVWGESPTAYAYQWQRSLPGTNQWRAVTGGTHATYTLLASDVGYKFRILVQATNGSGTGASISGAVGAVTASAPLLATAPTVTGNLRQGQTLTATNGVWNPTATSYGYQWQRSSDGSTWANIAGATHNTYIAAAADVNDYVRVVVTAINSVGSTNANSAATTRVLGAPVLVTAPSISGTAARGSTLTVLNGTWNPTPQSYQYVWQRSTNGGTTWTAISGATHATYVPTTADQNARLRVMVTAVNPYGSTPVATAATGTIA